MHSTNANKIKLEGSNLSAFCDAVQNKDCIMRELEFRYNKSSGSLLLCCELDEGVALTKKYQNSLVSQVEDIINTIVMPLTELTKHNFSLFIKIDTYGQIESSDIKIYFRINLNNAVATLHEKFHIPIRVFIPFIEHINYIKLRGRNHHLSVIETEVEIDQVSLLEIIKQPVVGEKAKSQWYSFITEAEREAKLEFKINLKIPVRDGSVTWDIPKKKVMQHLELWSNVKALKKVGEANADE